MGQSNKKREIHTCVVTEIGLVAGEIWRALDERDELSVSELMDAAGCSEELILMAAGWLAREAHITIKNENDSYLMRIRTQES